MSPVLNLHEAPARTSLTLVGTETPPELTRRLAALGLRRGVQLEISHGTAGGGRVIHVAGGRIALDRIVLRQLFAQTEVAS